jgi:hypothetical protein
MIEQYKSSKVYAVAPNTKKTKYILNVVASLDIFQLGNLEEIEKLLDVTCKAMSRTEGIKITYELSLLTTEEDRQEAPVDELVMEMRKKIKEKAPPFDRDLVDAEEISDVFNAGNTQRLKSPKAAAFKLKETGCCVKRKFTFRKKDNPDLVCTKSVWIVRNIKFYHDMDNAAFKKAWDTRKELKRGAKEDRPYIKTKVDTPSS